MSDVSHLIGKRVRVTRATIGVDDNCAWWCAGHVPVGSTGTIIEIPGNKRMGQIKWDHGQQPKTGYVFGIDEIGYELEEVPSE